MIKIFLAAFLAIPLISFATCNPQASIYYINGVNNPSLKKVRDDADLLKSKILLHSKNISSIKKVEALHNTSSGIFYDILYEFASQKMSETAQNFVENFVNTGMSALGHMGYLGIKDDGASLEIARRLNLNVFPESARIDIDKFEMQIRNTALMQGTQAILVAHSQGNMFANSIHERINQQIEKRYARGLGVLNVASPSSLRPNSQHVTIEEDRVIGMLRFLSSTQSLPAVANYSAPNARQYDLMGHNFANIYLADSLLNTNQERTPMSKEIVTRIDGLVSRTGTFWDVPNYSIDPNGNIIPRLPRQIEDSAFAVVCFPGVIGGVDWSASAK